MLALAVLLLLVRGVTVLAYRDTFYYYGMIAHQFGIAEAALAGHWFSHDAGLSGEALAKANREVRFVPIEEWARLPASGRYSTFPAVDLPGLGYLIAFTSRLAGSLTTRYAMVVQVGLEVASVILFAWCVALVFGDRVAWLTGLVYALAYPFIWPIASLPMRDIFIFGFYSTLLAAVFVLLRRIGPVPLALGAALLACGSLLLWVRPHGYLFNLFVLPLVLLAPGLSWKSHGTIAAFLVVIPWLVFERPLREFNLRHYRLAETDAIGRTLWEHMGIVKDNPYGFVLRDEAMLPWIKARYGRDVEYGTPEMNRILGDYARRVIREDPIYYFRTVVMSCLEMAKTPLDFVPPFRVVEFSSSGLTLPAFAAAHPGSFVFKAFNRVLLTVFFYGALLLALRMALRHPGRRWELVFLLSPLAFTVLVQALLHAEARYMATGAWVLTLPVGHAIAGLLETQAGRPPRAEGS
jgi:hypothetical protein